MPTEKNPTGKELTALMPALHRLARKIAPSKAIADDLMQEALLRVWTRIDAGEPIDELRPYLMTTLRNLSRRPARALSQLTDENMPCTMAEAPRRIATRDVLLALARLPEKDASLLVKVAFNGEGYAEVADVMGIPVGTIMSRVARARARLRADLDLPASHAVESLLEDEPA
ncbi:RNA polymerase sigma factor [Pseudohalocynthiibacter aestuariivivens]|jgi:RNA polymerase sigma-70 factor, ECF subfamily|uniref:RNA polymerase sigma factor n=1 Tax=Pseudohalocynthiibacter aestuariivivens TaxID=1591409 RepID=A0ABV5JHV8_9RHOB|nr:MULTISPECIES: RNA polymerase sigma factor [Pseudohalocynthiibacter]MBS9716391.1 RNA polymerase sigma factor [Pseudohalocynthiibacter aestuariivivens]MCK0100800.1 RNA polymerase sigma factor [Pseudohalocynthiibacter sp. F2068]